jgi:hypothetical protein
MTHALQFNGFQTSEIHQHSMMNSLAYRLNVAQSARNTQLIELLELEKQQLTDQAKDREAWSSQGSGLKAIIQGLNQSFFSGSTLQVSEFNSGSEHWWYAFDPQTGEQVYADSEVELRLWIKQNYHGR